MPLVRCFSTLGCPDLSLDAVFALAARYGIGTVELRALGGTLALPEYFEKRFGSPERLAKQIGREPVRVCALDSELRIVGGTSAERRGFLELVPWAEALGAPRVRVFDGGKAADRDELAQAAETIGWWEREKRRNAWRADIMVETHDSLLTAPAINRFRAVAPQTAILWDAHHTWRKGGENPAATWSAIGAAVKHVHVKDSICLPSDHRLFTYVLPGAGEFPIDALGACLQADNFAGLVSLEWEKFWQPDLPRLEEALAAAKANHWWTPR